MLEYGKRYPIEQLGEAQGNCDVFIHCDGRYDEYQVWFVLIESGESKEFFDDFDPKGTTPLAYFRIVGSVLVPKPVETVTRLGFKS